MSDLIDRQAAIDAIKAEMRYHQLQDKKWMLAEAIARIEEIPSAEPKRGKWIPMTEKLPEDGEHILISCTNGYVATITYSEVGERRHIVAWMPLPEPWRGEKE